MRLLLLFLLASTAARAQTDAILEVADVNPEIIGGLAALQSSIVYPDAERAAGREGMVILQFVVRPDGRADMVEVARSISPGLDSAAVAGVRAARFVPGRDKGEIASVRISLPVRFRIAEAAARPPAFSADTLLSRLGRPWRASGLPPAEALALPSGERRLVWTAPDAETERIEAVVAADTLRSISVTARAGSPALASVRQLASAVARERLVADKDSFYTARTLGTAGVPSRADIAFDLGARTWRFRARRCERTTDGRCIESPPVLNGGMRAFERLIRYPDLAADTETSGSVMAHFTVGPDGRTSGVTLDGTASGLPEEALRQAVVRAVEISRWTPATSGGQPVAARTELLIRFTFYQDWRD